MDDSPTLAAPDPFERWVLEALDALPAAFRDRLGSVAIVIEDDPSPAQLASVGAPGLFGLYHGVPRSAWGADGAPIASKITLFRGPIERQFASAAARRGKVIETVHHEIAHHFGITDRRLRELARSEFR